MRSLLLLSMGLFIILTSCSKSPEDIVKRYVNAKDIETKISCVVQDSDVNRLMKKKYDRAFFIEQGNYEYTDFYSEQIDLETGETINCAFASRSQKGSDRVPRQNVYYLANAENGEYLIDWRATNGIGDMTIKEFRIKKPLESTKLYVEASLSDYYNYEFRDASSEYQSIQLGSILLHGYVRRGTSDYERLSKYLQDGDSLPLTVMVRYTEYHYGGDLVFIDKFLHEYWGEPVMKKTE